LDSSTLKIKELGKLIFDFREAQKISQEELAVKAGNGLYRQLIGRIEAGKQAPTLIQAEAISEVLGSDVLAQWRQVCTPFKTPDKWKVVNPK
jgi:transcriptional regulator with XRE-family HTH domain